MASYYERIPNHLATWIKAQPMFFVATAPSGEAGHINLSPKGLDTFWIVDPHTVAYLDLVGSGAETIAHLRQNGRIVVMFCGFEQPRRILRNLGRGRGALSGDVRAFPAGGELSPTFRAPAPLSGWLSARWAPPVGVGCRLWRWLPSGTTCPPGRRRRGRMRCGSTRGKTTFSAWTAFPPWTSSKAAGPLFVNVHNKPNALDHQAESHPRLIGGC